MSRLLEGVARRLAGEQAVSRRDLIFAGGIVGALSADEAAFAEAPAHETSAPATTADLGAMRTAISRVPPRRHEGLALLNALRLPLGDGRMNQAALNEIHRIRSRLHMAHAEVAAISHRSYVRAGLLAYLADLDALLATLAQLGQSNDSSRAKRLRANAARIEKRANKSYRLIAPALDGHQR